MTRFISIDRVKIPEYRQRKEFPLAELNELADSIQKLGLLHAPILRISGDDYFLVAGERRLRSIADIYALGGSFTYEGETVPEGMIPYTTLGELNLLESLEAELEENIRRSDLTWAERAEATSRLMALRTGQAEQAGAPAPTTADIAKEVRGSSKGSNHDATRKELILAQNLHIPEVAAAKTADEAFKVLKKREQAQRNKELAESVGETFSYTQHKAFNVSCLEWLPQQPDGVYDVILTDPPYGMGADSFGFSEHAYKDDPETSRAIYNALAVEGFRVTKPDAHLYTFCDMDFFWELRELFTKAGWKVFRTPMIWHKPEAFRAPWPEQGPRRTYEAILYAVKGAKKVTKIASDVLIYHENSARDHSAQKPYTLFQDLLARSCLPGDQVLDICCGSGTIFKAAHELKCYATGLEISKEHFGLTLSRINDLDRY